MRMVLLCSLLIGSLVPLGAQQKPSVWWVHSAAAVHALGAALDGISSWKQVEANPLYRQSAGPQTGNFYRTGAARLTGVTLSIVAVSEVLSVVKPKWRRYIGALNFGAAAAHLGVVVNNVVRNPYYR